MEIKSKMQTRKMGIIDYTYRDVDSYDEVPRSRASCMHAYCFLKDKMVVVYAKEKGYWGPPGGALEQGEGIEGALVREVLEETNMKVIKHAIIGYQECFELDKTIVQTRSVCIVEPNGEFVADPDGDITEIKLIDPKDVKKYFDWGEVGNRIMERALEIKKNLV